MKILVVGGAGYVGGSVVDLLEKSNHDFIIYDSLLYEKSYRRDVKFVYGDVRDYDKLDKHLKWANCIIWLAALVGDQACQLDQPLTKEINTDTVKHLVDTFKGKIIFTSTASVYGIGEGELKEESKLNPLSFYAKTKLWSEEILKDSNALIFRLGTLFGISNHFSRLRSDLILNTLVLYAHAKNKLNIFGGEQYRPLIHVKDVAKIIFDNLESEETGIFNLHKDNVKILDLAKIVKKYFPSISLEIVDTKFEDSRNYQVSSEKAKKILGINPTITMDEGIIELRKILNEKRIVNPFNSQYSNFSHLEQLFKGGGL